MRSIINTTANTETPISFGLIKEFNIPEGKVTSISANDEKIYPAGPVNIVVLGDSIAAGHAINSDWSQQDKEKTQFGYNGRTEPTEIISNCYGDLLFKNLSSRCVNANITSFARSGDKVEDLLEKLKNNKVQNTIANANVVVLCIGANTVLGPALSKIGDYINDGNPALGKLEEEIRSEGFDSLSDNSSSISWFTLFNELKKINENAKYVFTTIYNPYKYLYIEEGAQGFFGPLVNWIKDYEVTINLEDFFNIDVPFVDLSFTINIGGFIREQLANLLINKNETFQLVIDRTNALGGSTGWVEKMVNNLNNSLINKINEYSSSNIFIINTKEEFDKIPDRLGSGSIHYNDLVNVEFTRGYDVSEMDWGALWREEYGDAWGWYWVDLIFSNSSFNWDAIGSSQWYDYISIDWDDIITELIEDTVEKVILPDIDPHPEPNGHNIMYKLYAEALNWI